MSVSGTTFRSIIGKGLLFISALLAFASFATELQAQTKRYIVTIKHASTSTEASRQNAIWVPGLTGSYARNISEAGQITNLHDRYLAAIRNDITAKVPTGRRSNFSTSVVRLSHFPVLIIAPNDEEFALIKSHPHTASITEEGISSSALNQAAAISHYETWRNLGNAGQGQVIAVLDGPFQLNHPMLDGKIDAEACFSSGGWSGPSQFFSLCPNGGPQQIGAGSSGNFAACGSGNRCSDHGTHVASTAAGAIVNSPRGNISGVARNARLVTVNTGSRNGPANDAVHFDGDLLNGLNWVYSQRLNGRNIVSVNLSIGNNAPWTTFCDSAYPAFSNIVQALFNAGVITVIAAGNSGYNGAMGYPACVPGVMSVANSTKADTGFVADSNRSSLTTIAAIGETLYAAVPTSTYGIYGGTSMAAPQVAGAIAVLRSNFSASTIDFRSALVSGTPKRFPFSMDYSIPRLDIGYANANFYSIIFGGGP